MNILLEDCRMHSLIWGYFQRLIPFQPTHPIYRHEPRKGWLALAVMCIMLVTSLPAEAQQWLTRHGLTSASYQALFDEQTSRDWRPTWISGYEQNGAARYLAVFTNEGGPALAARHDQTAAQHQATVTNMRARGFRPKVISAFSVNGQARYASIWERRAGPDWAARHGLTAQQYQSTVDTMLANGFRPLQVSVLSLQGSPRFAVMFEKNTASFVARHNMTAAEYQREFDRHIRNGLTLMSVSGYRVGNSDRYAAIWQRSGVSGRAFHNVSGSHYQPLAENMTGQGRRPVFVDVFNGGSGIRFNGFWRNGQLSNSDLQRIERIATDYLRRHDIPGVTLAVSRNGQIVFASGYGVTDQNSGFPVSPAAVMRVASVSKLLTREAMQRMAANGQLDLDGRVFGRTGVLGSRFATPPNNRGIEDITVQHMIDHQGGLLRRVDGVSREPTFQFDGLDHSALIRWALVEYPLNYTPGSAAHPYRDRYSNFHYFVLGRVIEQVSGETYEGHIRRTILTPAGARATAVGRNSHAERFPREARYHGAGAYTSVRPTVFDAHGGWVSTAPDLLRIARSMETAETCCHGGEMAGTAAILRQHDDEIAFAAIANSRGGGSSAIRAMMESVVESVANWPQQAMPGF
jgi:CubicO group peptidase (beta-lactamase class C family)